MYEGAARSRAETEYGARRRAGRPAETGSAPDRIAFWAVVMAVIAMVAAAASAQRAAPAASATRRRRGRGECPTMRFGSRALELGDCGGDVKTLHWILKAEVPTACRWTRTSTSRPHARCGASSGATAARATAS